ncbi:hypothetical protein [Rhodopseudomonas telluris]|uniref:Uncharacterized protein n=1 Tax=Rhodopseudomonas telluris TaxID=644215 RepID=A0ABV6EYP8_9BRAD
MVQREIFAKRNPAGSSDAVSPCLQNTYSFDRANPLTNDRFVLSLPKTMQDFSCRRVMLLQP